MVDVLPGQVNHDPLVAAPSVQSRDLPMSVKEVRDVVEHFLSQPDTEVLAIKGAWGVGKTYAWHHLIEEFKSKVSPETYCYVSLFGITSLADLRMAILTNSRPVEDVGSRMTLDSINRNW